MKWVAARWSMTEAAAYGSGDTQICRQNARDRRLSDSGTDALYSRVWKRMRCAAYAFSS